MKNVILFISACILLTILIMGNGYFAFKNGYEEGYKKGLKEGNKNLILYHKRADDGIGRHTGELSAGFVRVSG